jgi:hypothetical protein
MVARAEPARPARNGDVASSVASETIGEPVISDFSFSTRESFESLLAIAGAEAADLEAETPPSWATLESYRTAGVMIAVSVDSVHGALPSVSCVGDWKLSRSES